MNRQDWEVSNDPQSMLRHLLGAGEVRIRDVPTFPNCRTSARKLRLFACACYHRISSLLTSEQAAQAVAVAEQFADGRATSLEMAVASKHVWEPLLAQEPKWRDSRGPERAKLLPNHAALQLALQIVSPIAHHAAYYASSNAYLAFAELVNPGAARYDAATWNSQHEEEQAQAALIRCIFGDLFAAGHVCGGGDARALAQQIYDTNEFDKLPHLAATLEISGCNSFDTLNHCSCGQIHSRGCWVVDRVLGKN